MSKGLVEIYDTTLRDGTQGEGVSFSVADKLRVAERLDAFGVHYVEGGWPGSNPKDIEFFKQAAKRKWKHAQIAAFGSTRRKKTAAKDDPQVRLLVDAKTPVVTIFGKTGTALVTQGCLDIVVGVKSIDVPRLRHGLQLTAELLYLHHLDRVQDVTHIFDVAGINGLPFTDLATRVGIEGQQLIRVGLRMLAGIGEGRPQRGEDAGCQNALAHLSQEVPAGIVSGESFYVHGVTLLIAAIRISSP